MGQDPIVFTIFLIFSGAAVLATLALFARQSLLVAYVVVGVLLGTSGFGLIDDPALIEDISHIGIIFLLFLLGLNLNPRDLLHMVSKTTLVTVVSSLVFAVCGFAGQTVPRSHGMRVGEGVMVAVDGHVDDALAVHGEAGPVVIVLGVLSPEADEHRVGELLRLAVVDAGEGGHPVLFLVAGEDRDAPIDHKNLVPAR